MWSVFSCDVFLLLFEIIHFCSCSFIAFSSILSVYIIWCKGISQLTVRGRDWGRCLFHQTIICFLHKTKISNFSSNFTRISCWKLQDQIFFYYHVYTSFISRYFFSIKCGDPIKISPSPTVQWSFPKCTFVVMAYQPCNTQFYLKM